MTMLPRSSGGHNDCYPHKFHMLQDTPSHWIHLQWFIQGACLDHPAWDLGVLLLRRNHKTVTLQVSRLATLPTLWSIQLRHLEFTRWVLILFSFLSIALLSFQGLLIVERQYLQSCFNRLRVLCHPRCVALTQSRVNDYVTIHDSDTILILV